MGIGKTVRYRLEPTSVLITAFLSSALGTGWVWALYGKDIVPIGMGIGAAATLTHYVIGKALERKDSKGYTSQ